jgi:hypothetical protein
VEALVTNPKQMSQQELEEHLDKLIERGEDAKPTKAFVAAFEEYERRNEL